MIRWFPVAAALAAALAGWAVGVAHRATAPASESPPTNRIAWTRPRDATSRLASLDFHEPLVAVGDGIVSFRFAGRMCAFNASTGRQRWCTDAGDHPVFGAHDLVFVREDNTLAALSARSGAHVWNYGFHLSKRLTLPGARTVVWSVDDGFIASSFGRVDSGRVPFAALSASGRVDWLATDDAAPHGAPVALQPGRALIPEVASGAVLVHPWRFVRTGKRGGFGGRLVDAPSFLGARDGLYVFSVDPHWTGDYSEQIATFRVSFADRAGVERRVNSYAIATPASQQSCSSDCAGEAVAIDTDGVYGRVAGRIYRFAWGQIDPLQSRVVTDTATYVGRLLNGALVVGDAEGTWAIAVHGTAVQRTRLSTRQVQMYRPLRDYDVLGYAGGTVDVIDRAGRSVLRQVDCELKDAEEGAGRLAFACSRGGREIVAVSTPL